MGSSQNIFKNSKMRDKSIIIIIAICLISSLIIITIPKDNPKEETLQADMSSIKSKKLDTIKVKTSYYHAVARQCDDTPLTTADMSKIDTEKLKSGHIKWVALSRDLLKRWGGDIDYGDTITIRNKAGLMEEWIVHDCMNKRFKNRIDFLAPPNINSKVCLDSTIIIYD